MRGVRCPGLLGTQLGPPVPALADRLLLPCSGVHFTESLRSWNPEGRE
uniref:Adhesion G protein-coupled receptor E5 n=1 Tax=Mus musculus TaxID=10090 RepID=S4R1V8_MOUSE